MGHSETISAPQADSSRKLGGFRSTKEKFYANNTFEGNLLRVENNPKFKLIENLGYYATDLDGVVFKLINDGGVALISSFFIYPSPGPQ